MNAVIAYLMEHREMLQHLPPEMLKRVHQLVKAEQARMRNSPMPQSVVDDLTACVDDKLMADIVKDFRRTPPSPGMLPEKSVPVKRGSGWIDSVPLDNSVPGLKYIDQMCDVQDALDKREREKQFRG
jgi:hypothetical protein